MSFSEFTLIEKYFTGKQNHRDDVLLGIGDDGAITRAPADQVLVTTVDTLLEGTHFFSHTDAFDIGFKAAAVNLSDIAAMGAQPGWASIALTLPSVNEKWLAQFSEGLFSTLNKYDVQLIGGDTTRGPLSVSLQMVGFVPEGKMLTRSAAKPGDLVYVTGTLGDAGLGLLVAQGKQLIDVRYKDEIAARLNRPIPRVEQGVALRDIANAMIDVSDGLLSDLNHILKASHVGARVIVDKLPLSRGLASVRRELGNWDLPLSAGDDYELCFTVSPQKEAVLHDAAKYFNCPISCIGEILPDKGLQCLLSSGEEIVITRSGFNHFDYK